LTPYAYNCSVGSWALSSGQIPETPRWFLPATILIHGA